MSARQERNGRKFGEQGRAVVGVLQEHGVKNYTFGKGKHAEVAFNVGEERIAYRFACTPHSAGGAAKTVRRDLENLIVKARGAAAGATPKEKGGSENRNHPEKELTMLQQTIDRPIESDKAKEAAEPVFLNQNTVAVRRAKAWLSQRIEESKKLKPSHLMSEVVTITPALAELILLEHNTGNRAIRQKRVERWADTIREGRMKLTSQGISFARDGNLNNGQHRLGAIVAAGRPVQMNVTFGEDRECFDILDTGAPRSGGDALKIAGFKYTTLLAAGVRLYVLIKMGYANNSKRRVVSNDVLRSTLQSHPGLEGAAADAAKIVQAHRCSSAAVVAGLYIIESETRHTKRLDDFIDRIVDGADLKRADPILILRDGLSHRAFGLSLYSEMRAMATTAAMIRAWNLWVHGHVGSAKKLAWHPGQPFPEVE